MNCRLILIWTNSTGNAKLQKIVQKRTITKFTIIAVVKINSILNIQVILVSTPTALWLKLENGPQKSSEVWVDLTESDYCILFLSAVLSFHFPFPLLTFIISRTDNFLLKVPTVASRRAPECSFVCCRTPEDLTDRKLKHCRVDRLEKVQVVLDDRAASNVNVT